MLRSTQPRAVALASLALLAATACGGSRDAARTGDTTSASATPVVVSPDTTTPASGIIVPSTVTYEEADSVFKARDYARATEMFDAYTKRRSDNPWGQYMLGLAAWKSGQLDRARAAFEDALQLDPKHVKSMVNLARVLLEEDKTPDALARVQQALAVDSCSADGWRVLGRVYAQLRNTDEALGAYRTALAIDPQDTWSMNNMGLVLIRAGRYDEALGPLARAVQLSDEGVPSFQNNLGVSLERTGHYTLAADAYRKALDADTSYAKARVSLARVDGRSDDPGVDSVSVASLGDAFAQEVDAWHAARDVAALPHGADTTAVVKPDSVQPDSVKPDSVKP